MNATSQCLVGALNRMFDGCRRPDCKGVDFFPSQRAEEPFTNRLPIWARFWNVLETG